ncbi:hypothetical protein BHYA_0904g00020 [Botrytis hyacinthi]|uniref:Methyltransferase domain-containing protein n=1 Tax=Botrytis hyacinthi TaxID=278943 RepID=A0A4Z1G8Q0_9HELO|nr:hypothetical protein BHYA_0904g00020 [Botrytis hyacinthi]
MSASKGLQPSTLPLRHMVQLAHALLPLDSAATRGKVILDVGCGPGQVTEYLRADGGAVAEKEREGGAGGKWGLGGGTGGSMRCAGFDGDGAGWGGEPCVCEFGAFISAAAQEGVAGDEEVFDGWGAGRVYSVEGE